MRAKTILLSTATALLLLGIAAFYWLFDPAGTPWMPQCAFRRLTGLLCPGCGSQRMIHALLHGDFAAAWNANPFLLSILPIVLLMAFAAAKRTSLPRLYRTLNSPTAIAIAAAAIILWTLLRNTLLK